MSQTTAPKPVGQPHVEAAVPDHDADLYSAARTAETVGHISEVGDEHLAFFREHGYLAVEQAFSPASVAAALTAIDHLVDGGNPDFRGLQFEARVGDKAALTREERHVAVRKLMGFVEYDERLGSLARDPASLALVRRVIGQEPVLFQDMALLKPPRIGREKPWHQDHAYFNLPVETIVVGLWIALDEATAENGALHIIPGSHRNGPVDHFKRRDWQICDTEVERARDVVVPLKPGGALFWYGMTHHGSPRNQSEHRRRALQFHYRPASAGEVTTEERMRHFGGEVRGAYC